MRGKTGGKDAKEAEIERISLQVLQLEWRGEVGRLGTDAANAGSRKESRERCDVPTVTTERRRDGGTWKNLKENYSNAKVV